MRSWPLLVVLACSTPERAHVPGTPPSTPGLPTAPGLRLPDDTTPLSYRLTLEVDPDQDTFRGEVHIRVRLTHATDHVWIHAVDLDIDSARYDGGALALLPVTGDQMRVFSFGHVVAAGEHELAFTYTGHATKDEEGLFRQRAGTRWYMFSQGQAVFARRITPCFDEPRFKTPWRVTLVVPRDQVALANGPEEHMEPVDAHHKRLTFGETRAMPSYLLAIAVGPFDVVDAGVAGKNKIPVRVAVHAGGRKQVGVAAEKIPAIVAALEAYTGDVLPLSKLDLVAVPHLFGAMENPGLITIDEPILIGSPQNKPFAGYFTQVAAHELVHQWFGNLVTPAWWDDLWLSEAFASWLGDKIARQLGSLTDPLLHAALARREALEADAGASAIPLRRPIKANRDPDESFDSIAYSKGQIVLATFEAWLGEDRLRDALRAYLREHRDGVATTRELVAAIARIEPQAGKAFEQYATTVGAPVVELALRCERKPVMIASARNGQLVPVCVRPAGATRPSCALVGARTEIPLDATCPAWVLGNPNAGYYHVAWSAGSARPPLAQLDAAGRIVIGDDLAAAVARGELVAKDALAELRALSDSREVYAQLGAIAIAHALDELVDDATRPAWTRWLAARFKDRLATRPSTPREGDIYDALLEMLPADRFRAAQHSHASAIVDELISHDDDLSPVAGLLVFAAAETGDKLFARIVDKARATIDDDARRRWLELLAEFPAPFAERTAALAIEKPDLPIDLIWGALADYFRRPATRTAAWRALRPRVEVFLKRLPERGADVIRAAASLCDKPVREEVAAAFAPHLARIVDGRVQLDSALASIDRCIARRTRVGDLGAALAAAR